MKMCTVGKKVEKLFLSCRFIICFYNIHNQPTSQLTSLSGGCAPEFVLHINIQALTSLMPKTDIDLCTQVKRGSCVLDILLKDTKVPDHWWGSNQQPSNCESTSHPKSTCSKTMEGREISKMFSDYLYSIHQTLEKPNFDYFFREDFNSSIQTNKLV